jgi:type VI secretion system protein ImpL
VKKAYEIRLAMFPSGENPSVKFSVRTNPPRIEGAGVNVRWISFDVGGRFATYSMGQPQFQELEWPGTDPGVGAALRAQLSGGAQADSRNIPGPWGLFKLLDQGQYVSAGDQPQISWRLQAGGSALITTYEIQPSSQRHPFRPGFLRFSVPDTP